MAKRIITEMISFETYLEDPTFRAFVIEGMGLDYYCGDYDWPHLAMEPVHRVLSLEDQYPPQFSKKKSLKRIKEFLWI